MRRGADIAEQFSTEEMAKTFIRAYSGIILADGEILVFDFHGVNLRGVVKGLSVVELADAQKRGASQTYTGAGILMDKTDVNFIKAADNPIKLKSSSKKYVPLVTLWGRPHSLQGRHQMPSWRRTSSLRIWELEV